MMAMLLHVGDKKKICKGFFFLIITEILGNKHYCPKMHNNYISKEPKIFNGGVSQKDRMYPHYSWIELYSRCLYKCLENSLVQWSYFPVGFLWNFPIRCCTSISLWYVKYRLGFPKVHFMFLSFCFLMMTQEQLDKVEGGFSSSHSCVQSSLY